MASTSSSFSDHTSGTAQAASVDTSGKMLSSGSSSINGSETHQPLTGSDLTGTVHGSTSSDSSVVSTPLLFGIFATSVIVLVAVLFVIRYRRRCHERKLFSPSNISAFQRVTSTMASEHSSNVLVASCASTVMTSPQPPLMETFTLPKLLTKEVSGDHVALDIQDLSSTALAPERSTQLSRTTSLISGRSVFSASILGLRSSQPSLPGFRASHSSRTSAASRWNTLQSMDSSTTTVSFEHTESAAPTSSAESIRPPPMEQRQPESDAWRDLSDTCWSIGPGSDSETESELFAIPAVSHVHGGALMLNRNQLSTLSNNVGDIEEESSRQDPDVNSLDDSSRRRDRAMNSLDDLSPRRERGISEFDDSSPRRVRGLSALDSRRKAYSLAHFDTNESGGSYFSVGSDFYDDTIKDCSSVLFDDSDGDSSDSDSDDSLREEEF